MIEENPQVPEKLIKLMQRLTRHGHVRFTNRGNSAIFLALCMAKRSSSRQVLLIPDQGGWLSYKNYPKFFGFVIKEIKTDYGIIDLEDLERHAKISSALLLPSFAGYFAEQPIKDISKICKAKGCLLIEDASGALGYSKLCNGKYSDIIVGSFGHWQPMGYGYGGFISVKNPNHFDLAKDAFSMFLVHPEFYSAIMKELKSEKLKMIMKKAEQVKNELKKYEIIHADRKGLNVVVKFDPAVIEYCTRKGYPYMLCPNYIRVNERAVSIELKRLEDGRLFI